MLQHDVESYSEAGYVLDEASQKWKAPHGGGTKKGLPVVGADRYWEHPTAEVLILRYRWPHWPEDATKVWFPGQPCPPEIKSWIEAGGFIEAHNNRFERLAWHWCLTPKHGFPEPKPEQWFCTAATARVNSLPGGLERLGDALGLAFKKDAEGKRLIRKFSIPRDATKKDPRLRVMPTDDPEDFARYDSYCADDVLTEAAAERAMAPMTPDERRFWLIDQEINWRGIGIDRKGVRDCIAILDQAIEQYGEECRRLTGGLGPSQVAALVGWINGRMQSEPPRTPLGELLEDDIPF